MRNFFSNSNIAKIPRQQIQLKYCPENKNRKPK